MKPARAQVVKDKFERDRGLERGYSYDREGYVSTLAFVSGEVARLVAEFIAERGTEAEHGVLWGAVLARLRSENAHGGGA